MRQWLGADERREAERAESADLAGVVRVPIPGRIDGQAGREAGRDDRQVILGLEHHRRQTSAGLGGGLGASGNAGGRRAGGQCERQRDAGRGGRQQADAHHVEECQQVLLRHLIEPLDGQLEQAGVGQRQHQAGVVERPGQEVPHLLVAELLRESPAWDGRRGRERGIGLAKQLLDDLREGAGVQERWRVGIGAHPARRRRGTPG